MAETERSILTKQCLARRLPDIEPLTSEGDAWESQRNQSESKIDWHFTTTDARVKLKRLYPSFQV